MIVLQILVFFGILFSVCFLIYGFKRSGKCQEHNFVLKSSSNSYDHYECNHPNCNKSKGVHKTPETFMNISGSDKSQSSGNEVSM